MELAGLVMVQGQSVMVRLEFNQFLLQWTIREDLYLRGGLRDGVGLAVVDNGSGSRAVGGVGSNDLGNVDIAGDSGGVGEGRDASGEGEGSGSSGELHFEGLRIDIRRCFGGVVVGRCDDN